MKYYGVIVDMLTRTTEIIESQFDEKRPDKEFASAFCFCKWFGEYQNPVDEIMARTYEIEIIKMFNRLNVQSPSPFAII